MRGYFKPAAILLALAQTSQAAGECTDASSKDAQRTAEQTIVLLQRMATDSAPSRRVSDQGSPEAKALLSEAMVLAAEAQRAYEAGCFDAALATAGDGLARATRAFRVDADDTQAERKAFEALRGRAVGFLQTLEDQPVEVSGIDESDFSGMQRQVARADALALRGEFAAAVDLIAPVADRLQRRIVDIFDRKTLVYAREFASPAEEYAYLAEQGRGYRMLLGSSTAKDPGAASAIGLIEQADIHREQAEAAAAESEWNAAVAHMESAIEIYEKAVRAARIFN